MRLQMYANKRNTEQEISYSHKYDKHLFKIYMHRYNFNYLHLEYFLKLTNC